MRRHALNTALALSLLAGLAACDREPASPAGERTSEPSTASTRASADDTGDPASDATPGIDPETGMLMADGWTVVRDHCIACHSPQQFLRQRGTRRTWSEIVLWMQEKAGLGKIAPEAEAAILDYLVAHHGPREGSYRRAPLSPRLLPPNPYESEIERARRTNPPK